MSGLKFERVENPSEELIDASVDLFVSLMKDSGAIKSLCGGDASLAGLMTRPMLNAGSRFGEYYTATDENGELVGYTLWMPPGLDLFSTPEQRAMGLNEFMVRLPEEGKEYYKTTYMVEFPAFVNSVLGPTGKTDSWWLHIAMVRPDRQRQGVLRALIQLVREKAKLKGETLACSTTSATNALVYKALGFDLMGDRIMPSPWGDWPLYVFRLDTSKARD